MDKKIAGYLGISARARKVSIGETAYKAIVGRNAKFVFIANDASPNTKKRVLNVCNQCKVQYIDCYSSEEISDAIGQVNRMVVAIEDNGLAKHIMSCLK